jgi:hypothetical protein
LTKYLNTLYLLDILKTFIKCKQRVLSLGGFNMSNVKNIFENIDVIPENTVFPYKKIINNSQFIDAFEFIVNEIELIYKEIEIGIHFIFSAFVIYEDINIDEYNKTSKKIQDRVQKIENVENMIQAYLTNRCVERINLNKQINLGDYVEFVNLSSSIVKVFGSNNKRQDSMLPSIQDWINYYNTSIEALNKIINLWNVRFNTAVNKADTVQ